jgi:hypothetical protein
MFHIYNVRYIYMYTYYIYIYINVLYHVYHAHPPPPTLSALPPQGSYKFPEVAATLALHVLSTKAAGIWPVN